MRTPSMSRKTNGACLEYISKIAGKQNLCHLRLIISNKIIKLTNLPQVLITSN